MGVQTQNGGNTAPGQLEVENNHQGAHLFTDRDVKSPFSGSIDNRNAARRGNNKYGNKGTPKCFHCRRLKRACHFGDDLNRSCDNCVKKGLTCGVKHRCNEQLFQSPIQGDKDIKQPFSIQEQATWSQQEDLLPKLFAFTRASGLPDYEVALKMHGETRSYLEQNQESYIPAPMVQPGQLTSFPAPQSQYTPTEALMAPQPAYLDPSLVLTAPRSTPTPRSTNNYFAFAMPGNYYAQPDALQHHGGSNSHMPELPSGPSLQVNVSSDSQNSMFGDDQPNYDSGLWTNNPRPIALTEDAIYAPTHCSTPSFNSDPYDMGELMFDNL